MKISLLIPVTSNRRSFSKLEDSPLISILLDSFLKYKEEGFEYTFYVGYDKGDRFYTLNKKKIIDYFKSKGIKIVYKEYHNNQKSPVFIWNKLFEDAYNNSEDYFYQIGDDIEIKSKWTSKFVDILKINDVGVTGPLDLNNSGLLTQSFVTRKHMNIFGYYFPHEFKNWYCDNWIQDTYKGCDKLFKLEDVIVRNSGGSPRYVINKSPLQILGRKVEESISKINDYIPSKVNVYYNHYAPKEDVRKKEMGYCLDKLTNSENIDNLYLIISNEDYKKYKNPNPDKIKVIISDERPTYRYVFDLIDSKTGINDYNITLNSDCYIEESSYKFLSYLKRVDCWALTRWNIINEKMDLKFKDRKFSQDCWIIKGNPKKINDINFNFGKPGCDNRIAYKLKKGGYNIYNPSIDFRVIHYHVCDIRNYTHEDRVKGGYIFLDPIKIKDIGIKNDEEYIERRVHNTNSNDIKKDLPNLGGYVKNPGLNRVRKKHWKLRRNRK